LETLGPAPGTGTWLIPIETRYRYTAVSRDSKSRHSGVKPFGRNYGNPPENFDPLQCPAFQGHSRSLEPTPIDRLYLYYSVPWDLVIQR